MKAKDVINQLITCLPLESKLFTDNFLLAALANAEPVITVDTAVPHQAKAKNLFHLVGTRSQIDITSFARAGAVGTIITTTPHDRTFERVPALDQVTVRGATEDEFNGTFVITGVVDRNTIQVVMFDPGTPPTALATGSPVGEDLGRFDRSFDRLLSVDSIIDTTQFTATTVVTGAPASPLITSGAEVRLRPRISGAINLDRAMEAYTSQADGKLWAYVILGDTTASRGQDHASDATDRQVLDESWKQQVIVPFSVAVFAPSKNNIAARAVRDSMSDLWAPLSRCLLGQTFPTQLSNGICGGVNFVGHGTLQNAGGFYVHGFSFEVVEELGFGDTVGYNDNVAFRNIDITIIPDLDADQGEGEMTAVAALDMG